MKYLVQTACAAAFIGLSSNGYAAVNGINYDPAHDPQWIEAQGGKPPPNNRPSNPAEMERTLKRDLDQIVGMGFKIIKTYYAKFTGYDGKPLPDDIAKIAQQKGIQVMLGVFEFRPGNPSIGEAADGCNRGGVNDPSSCRNWTRQQADVAISQANSYGDTVIGIVVGNEDMFNQPGAECCVADPLIEERVAEDIDYIKGKVSIPVTTAQRQPDWVGRDNSINKTNPNGILGKIAVAGVNIFPILGS